MQDAQTVLNLSSVWPISLVSTAKIELSTLLRHYIRVACLNWFRRRWTSKDSEMDATRHERAPENRFGEIVKFLIKVLRFYGNGLNPLHGGATVRVSKKTGKIVSVNRRSSVGRNIKH
jgi:hypothetical protein